MRAQRIRLLAVTAIAAVTAVTAGVSPGHAASLGTYTRITSPSGVKYLPFNADVGATNHFTVSGRTSSNVTSVDIECYFHSTTGLTGTSLSASVPVSGGAFSTIATIPNFLPQCQLIALPSTDTLTSTYLASFTGPLIYIEATGVGKIGSVVDAAFAADEQGNGLTLVGEEDSCEGVELMATIRPPAMTVEGTGSEICLTSLAPTNLAGNGSALKVDGQNVYLPVEVNSYLNGSESLGLKQTALTASFHVAANHDLTFTESAPLMKCSHANDYPPTSKSCPSLAATGVRWTRVIELFRGAHQALMSYRLTSIDGAAHSVTADFETATAVSPNGAIGYSFPGHGSTLKPVSAAQKITGLGAKAATMVIRSDVDASPSDLTTQSFAITWSRAPSGIQFKTGSTSEFGMQYVLPVPAHGAAGIGFADSEETTTAPALSLGKLAVAAMMATPAVTKPSGVVHGKSTTVAGTVAAGVNGLVRTVTVDGHKATLTPVGITSDKFTVTFKESVGIHKLTVVATDVAGNTATKTIKVHNQA